MLRKAWKQYKEHEAAFRLVFDVMLIAFFIAMGVLYQPEIIRVCEPNTTAGIATNLSLNTSVFLNLT